MTDWITRLVKGVRHLFFSARRERELEDELRHHILMETEKNIREGMTPGEARRKALVDFGGVDQFKERTRGVSLLAPVEDLIRDIRFAFRRLRRTPASTLAIVLCLGLGLGAATGVFSFFFGIVLRPLPFDEVDRLAILFETSPEATRASPTFTDYEGWRENASAFSDLGAYTSARRTITGAEGPEILDGGRVTWNLFRILGVQPALGRGFGPQDDGTGAPPVILLSHRLWRERYGGGRDVLGMPVVLDEATYTVVGVMPPGFAFPEEASFWVPLRTAVTQRGGTLSAALGRLDDGVTWEGVRTDMARVAALMREAYPRANAEREIAVRPLEEDFLWGLKTPVTLFLVVAAFVLLLAIANVANLLLAQGTARGREMVVRTAMGAGRPRVLRQLLTESLLLAFAGGAVGVALGILGRNLYLSFLPEGFPYYLDFGVDGPVLGLLALVILSSGLLFGLAPALATTRVDLFSVLRGGGEGGGGSEGFRRRGWRDPRAFLMVLQTGLALVVLVGAGMMARSLGTLRQIPTGLDAENVLTAQILFSPAMRDDDRLRLAHEEIRDRVESLPGVTRAALISHLPIVGAANFNHLHVEGTEAPPPGQEPLVVAKQSQPGYFETMGIPLVAGREFLPEDGAPGSPPVVIVNESFAGRYWPEGGALGRRVKWGRPEDDFPWMEVVGVVADVRHLGPERPVMLGLYVPVRQTPFFRENLVVKTAGDPMAVVQGVLAEIREVDPDAPVYDIRSMEEVLFRSYWRPVVLARLLWIFSGMALLLAGLGVYGIVTFTTTQRRREFGIRMALGAEKAVVLGGALQRTLIPTSTGLLLGVGIAWIGMRSASSLMFGVEAMDPQVAVAGVLVMTGVAFLATWLPARRAAGVDPAEVLKGE